MNRRTFLESGFAAAVAAGSSRGLAHGGTRTAGAPQSASAETGQREPAPGDLSQSIAGRWRLRLDPGDTGLAGQWHRDSREFDDQLPLPGSTSQSSFGKRNELHEAAHLTRTYVYTGPAWYQRDVEIPESWRGKRVGIYLERCHWQSRAWLDEEPLGLRNSLSTPHIYDAGIVDKQAGERNERRISTGLHRLTLRVDNRTAIDLGRSTAVTVETGSRWNGVIGRMELEATDLVWIERVTVDPGKNAFRLKLDFRNLTGEEHAADLRCAIHSVGGKAAPVRTQTRVTLSAMPFGAVERELTVPAGAVRWSEFSPALFDLSVELESVGPGERFRSTAQVRFGLRELSTAGRQLQLNGRTIVLRGTVDNGIFPQQGHEPADLPFWRQRMGIYREYGFNHVRFHSWCPPEAAFAAADELGLLLQVANPLWVADGRVSADDERCQFLREEAIRIVDTYGNHPSFGLMSMGNEEGSGQDSFLGHLVRKLQQHDSRHLYTSTTQPDNIHRPDDYFVSAGPRWQNLRGDPRLENNPPNTNVDYEPYISAARIDRPVLAHELGQWTVYPNLQEGGEYTGPLQPRFLEIYRESLQRGHLLGRAESFRRASGALMVALYKEEVEAVLRTKDASGFQLLGLTDFPGFGPAFIGVLDTLGKSKGLIEPAAYRRFCSPTVPLLLLAKRAWTTGETLHSTLKVAHYGEKDLHGVTPSWSVRDSSGKVAAFGKLPSADIPAGALMELGTVQVKLSRLAAPAMYSIECRVGDAANDWNVWVYPHGNSVKQRERTGKVTITKTWRDARSALDKGETVALLLDPREPARTVPTSFTTIFWSASWFPKRHETMGVLCDPSHPAFRLFPTAASADWQWWELMSQSRAFDLSAVPEPIEPVVHVIDDAARARRLGAVFEARVGSGRLLATSFDLDGDLAGRPVAAAFRSSLIEYAASPDFHPAGRLAPESVELLLSENAVRNG